MSSVFYATCHHFVGRGVFTKPRTEIWVSSESRSYTGPTRSEIKLLYNHMETKFNLLVSKMKYVEVHLLDFHYMRSLRKLRVRKTHENIQSVSHNFQGSPPSKLSPRFTTELVICQKISGRRKPWKTSVKIGPGQDSKTLYAFRPINVIKVESGNTVCTSKANCFNLCQLKTVHGQTLAGA